MTTPALGLMVNRWAGSKLAMDAVSRNVATSANPSPVFTLVSSPVSAPGAEEGANRKQHGGKGLCFLSTKWCLIAAAGDKDVASEKERDWRGPETVEAPPSGRVPKLTLPEALAVTQEKEKANLSALS